MFAVVLMFSAYCNGSPCEQRCMPTQEAGSVRVMKASVLEIMESSVTHLLVSEEENHCRCSVCRYVYNNAP